MLTSLVDHGKAHSGLHTDVDNEDASMSVLCTCDTPSVCTCDTFIINEVLSIAFFHQTSLTLLGIDTERST